MSYLLTEIALEMLGYKFYDCNGVYAPTNFQNNVPDKGNTKTTEASTSAAQSISGNKRKITNSSGIKEGSNGKVAKHDATIDPETASTTPSRLQMTTETAHQTATKPKTTSEPDTTAVPVAASPAPTPSAAPPSAAPPSAAAPAAERKSAASQTSGQKQVALPPALIKLLHQEYEKTRKEMINNKLHYINQNAALAKRAEPRSSNATNEFVQSYIAEERNHLQKEAQVMRDFRVLTEKKLVHLNTHPYEIYMRTFKLEKLALFVEQHRHLTNNQE